MRYGFLVSTRVHPDRGCCRAEVIAALVEVRSAAPDARIDTTPAIGDELERYKTGLSESLLPDVS